jgi:hypothetical protein
MANLRLNMLRIERQQWGADKDKLFGEIAFENQYSKVSVKLTEDQAYKLLAIVAGAVVENAQETSRLLVSDLQRPQAEIEGDVQ